MGKKRIAAIDLSKEEKKPKHSGRPKAGLLPAQSYAVAGGEVAAKKKKTVKSAKQQGRLIDMGQVMLEEMEKRKETEADKKKETLKTLKKTEVTEKKSSAPSKKFSALSVTKKPSKPRVRSARYQTLRKLIKSDKIYPLLEAIELLKKSSNAKFNETIELHLIAFETGKLSKDIKTEKKFPLAHIKIGKVKETKKKLEEKIQAIFKTIGPNKIKKAVLTSTMSPGIKIDTSLPDRQ